MDIKDFEKAKVLLDENAKLKAHLNILTQENEKTMVISRNRPIIFRDMMELLGEPFSDEIRELFITNLKSKMRTNSDVIDKL